MPKFLCAITTINGSGAIKLHTHMSIGFKRRLCTSPLSNMEHRLGHSARADKLVLVRRFADGCATVAGASGNGGEPWRQPVWLGSCHDRVFVNGWDHAHLRCSHAHRFLAVGGRGRRHSSHAAWGGGRQRIYGAAGRVSGPERHGEMGEGRWRDCSTCRRSRVRTSTSSC